MMRDAIRCVLVANRGEIAVRIIRACRELGMATVQAYSEADRDSLPVRLADRSVCIGHAPPSSSYLNPVALVSAAVTQGADAIHPGYGFLSENAGFARLCERNGVAFVGPRASTIELMGNKAQARAVAESIGVPTVPGSSRPLVSAEQALGIAQATGYPLLLKAAAGGGGRGIRLARDAAELEQTFDEARAEAFSAFGDGSLYIERYVAHARHIEIQVLADTSQVLHLGERDCSLQRRRQKLLEESPSPALDAHLRHEIGGAAVRLARHIGYTSAGTVEFLLDEDTGRYYFMEMNTRLQVEHGVTEMTSGIDIVKQQLAVAAGKLLDGGQQDVRLTGHAIECRINAEDPDADFAPSPGLVSEYHAPGGPGVRIDSHLYGGYRVPRYYDSLLAKVIVWGADRAEALARMRRALGEMVIQGPRTTLPFMRRLLDDAGFQRGAVHTRYVEDVLLAGPVAATRAMVDPRSTGRAVEGIG